MLGIIPLTFENEADYDDIDMEDELLIENARDQIKAGSSLVVRNVTNGKVIKVNVSLSERQVEIILAGGLINYTKQQSE